MSFIVTNLNLDLLTLLAMLSTWLLIIMIIKGDALTWLLVFSHDVVDDKSLLGVVFQPTRQVAARGEAQEPKTTGWEFFCLFSLVRVLLPFFFAESFRIFWGLWIIAFFPLVRVFFGFGLSPFFFGENFWIFRCEEIIFSNCQALWEETLEVGPLVLLPC